MAFAGPQPFPQNLETAQALEAIVRSNGATPATIAILKGAVTVGLEPQQLRAFASLSPKAVLKASRRDIGPAVANGVDAATTVAGTMYVGPWRGCVCAAAAAPCTFVCVRERF